MTNPTVRTVILAGGKGRRLAPLTTVVPKPLIPIGDHESILEVLIQQLVAQGLPRITVSLGHLGHLIRAVIGDGSQWGADVDYTEEAQPLGTAGALGLLADLAEDEIVLAINGDTFTDLSFRAVIDHHVSKSAAATIVAHRQRMTIDFGVVRLSADGSLESYDEKPVTEFMASTGINVISASVVSSIEKGSPLDMPDLLRQLLVRGQKVSCVPADCFWLDLGRFGDLDAATEQFAKHRARFLPDD